MARLTTERYGKTKVRMVKVRRDPAIAGEAPRHHLRELTVRILLEGDFASAYAEGSNRQVLPTDTMKNTVYALGKNHSLETPEAFAVDLARHFVESQPQVSGARVEVEEVSWLRLEVDGAEHPHSFERGSAERTTAEATVDSRGTRVESGLRDLVVLKTAQSGFEGFVKDHYTTLPEVADRLLGTSITARWLFAQAPPDYAQARSAIRTALVETFARHESRSVQHSLFAMAEAALAACAEIGRIHLVLPNKHCLLVDLSPFDLANENEIFLPVDEPAGYIEATIER